MRIYIPYRKYTFVPPLEIRQDLLQFMASTSQKEFREYLDKTTKDEKREFIRKSPYLHWASVISVAVLTGSVLLGILDLITLSLGFDNWIERIIKQDLFIAAALVSFLLSFVFFRSYLTTYSSFQKYLRDKKRFYLKRKKEIKTLIIACVKCGAKNQVIVNTFDRLDVCGRCGAQLPLNLLQDSQKTTFRQDRRTNPIVYALLLCLLAFTGYGIYITPNLLSQDFSALARKEAETTEEMGRDYDKRLSLRRATLEIELSKINPSALHKLALDQYKRELDARRSFEKRYALSSREKAQLRMRSIASDSTKTLHDAIKAVAREASPKGADITVRETRAGIVLDIDFDMSSMTSGEHGTRTKHHTKKSLRKEVISLISRVTNDIFQFCKDLHLTSIHVGCRHIVRTTYQSQATRDENTVLYKIRIRKNQISGLTNNPFLDIYSTTHHFEVEKDNFKNIEIVTTKI